LNKANFISLSKDSSISIIKAERAYLQSEWNFIRILDFLELICSPFMSIRILENRYFQSRSIILKELKKINFNLSDIKLSISHNKRCFIALITKKGTKIEIDHEPASRVLSKALEKRINQVKKPNSLSNIEFINMLETFVKIKHKKWHSILMNLEIKKMFDLKDTYITNLGDETIYSKFYSYNDNQICISSDKLEILR
tara:strand:- start:9200 stop:9793 length:594 start_codon:yes stop_codon:yes gene_type:complete